MSQATSVNEIVRRKILGRIILGASRPKGSNNCKLSDSTVLLVIARGCFGVKTEIWNEFIDDTNISLEWQSRHLLEIRTTTCG